MDMHGTALDVRQIIADQRAARVRLRSPSRIVDRGINLQKPSSGIKSGDAPKPVVPAPRPKWKFPPLPKDHPAKVLFDAFERPGLSIVHIVRVVANHFCVPPIEIFSERREKRIVIPRHIVMYLAKTLTTASLPKIGLALGGRDHTTILSAVRKIERLRLESPEVDAEISVIEKKLLGTLA